jgi:hypothetical protein
MLKKIVSLLMALTLVTALLAGAASAAYENNVDYMGIMIEAAKTGDYTKGNAAEAARNEKIDSLGLNVQKIKFQDLYLLAKVIYIEAGSSRIPDDWKLAVGEVLLNRVASPEFPNTVYEVVYQKGQYASAGTSAWAGMMPDEHCINLAIRLLEGERHLESSVVFQANFRQGSGVYKAYYDSLYGWTYFCYSSRPWMYSGETTETTPTPTPTPTPEPEPEEDFGTAVTGPDSVVITPNPGETAPDLDLDYVTSVTRPVGE